MKTRNMGITKQVEYYPILDGVRSYAALGIVLMHVRGNGGYNLPWKWDYIINSFTDLTFLFMLLSSFSMCCGYYERFKNNSISLEAFYRRRYQRVWPFFAFLCTVDLIMTHNLTTFYEWAADLTLAFGLISNNGIEVIGVGWFLGTVFLFYMLFPFFVFLIGTKKRAWFSFLVSFILHLLCLVRFQAMTRADFIYSSVFFVAGGIIYLYRNELRNLGRFRFAVIALSGCFILAYYRYKDVGTIFLLIIFSFFAILAISPTQKMESIRKAVFCNPVIIFVSRISLEIYLCHMLAFRALEKMHFLHPLTNELMNYLLASTATILGAILITVVYHKSTNFILETIKRRKTYGL